MPAQLLLGTGGGRVDHPAAGAGAPWAIPRLARGLAAGDLDNDGRVDLLVASLDVPLAYFHNRTAGGAGLTLDLEATAGHRSAIGARVVVTAGDWRQTTWKVGGGSFQSACDPRLHFGLGGAASAESVEVTWPSGRVDRYGAMAAERGYLLREGDPSPQRLRGFAESPRTPAADTDSSHPVIDPVRRTDS
jgi:hypothetical protein